MNTYRLGLVLLLFLPDDVLLYLALHLVQLRVETYQDPCVTVLVFIVVNTPMDHHLVITDQLGNMSLSGRWLLTKSLKLGPDLFLDVKLVYVAEAVVFALATAAEHDQTFIDLPQIVNH